VPNVAYGTATSWEQACSRGVLPSPKAVVMDRGRSYGYVHRSFYHCDSATRLFIGSYPLNIRAPFINKRATLITCLGFLCVRSMFGFYIHNHDLCKYLSLVPREGVIDTAGA
jgi:hypothetical protein